MGGDQNTVTVISENGANSWPRMEKEKVGRRLAKMISDALA
jgi:phosphopantothenoylcysteine decarboxylase/phosphopantothenate--cysteine ligase